MERGRLLAFGRSPRDLSGEQEVAVRPNLQSFQLTTDRWLAVACPMLMSGLPVCARRRLRFEAVAFLNGAFAAAWLAIFRIDQVLFRQLRQAGKLKKKTKLLLKHPRGTGG